MESTAIDLQKTNKKVQKAIEYVNKDCRLTSTATSSLSHDIGASLNRGGSSIFGKLLKAEEWKVSLPYAVFTSDVDSIEVDICHRRTLTNDNYRKSIRLLPAHYKHVQSKKLYRAAAKKNIYSHAITTFTELLERNPDEYFSGRYDWYYTGGNLEMFEYDNRNYIAHATGENLQNIDISRIEPDKNYKNLSRILSKKSKAIISSTNEPEILEFQNFNCGEIPTFTARRKYFISLYEYQDSKLTYKYHLNSCDVPFISSTKVSANSLNIITTDFHKKVSLWDLNRSNETPTQILYSTDDERTNTNWNRVQYLDEHLYAFVDINEFCILDSRIPFKRSNLTSVNITKDLDQCAKITSMCISKYNNLIYIGSTHKLQVIDKRYMGDDDKYNLLMWVHQMKSSPLMLRTTKRNSSELIVLGSAKNGDVRVVENDRVKLEKGNYLYNSFNLPLKPPGIKDTYQKARLNGSYFDPSTSLLKRLECCHTGMILLNQENNISMFTSNSNGDIFCQHIVDTDEVNTLNESIVTSMGHWQIQVRNSDYKINRPLVVTYVENVEPMRKIFRCDRLTVTKNRNLPEEPKPQLRPRKWQRSVNTLRKFKDALASDILSIWDIETEDEIETKVKLPSPEDMVYTTQPPDIVSEWLNNTEENVNDPILDSTVPDESFITLNDTMQSNISTSAVKLKQSNRRKYVKGF